MTRSPNRTCNMTIPQITKPWAYLKFYGSDFLNATAGWTMEERGIYITLLWYSWVNDGLPADIDRIDRMAPGAKRIWQTLDDKFPVCDDGKRRNPRMERDRAPFKETSQRMANRAVRAANARWHASDDASSMLQASDKQCFEHHNQNQNHNQSNTQTCADALMYAEQGDSDNHKETKLPRGGRGRPARRLTGDEDPVALLVYDAYPRKVARGAAVREIQRALDRIEAVLDCDRKRAGETLRDAVIDFSQSVKGTEVRFIPHPRTWFAQGRWEDYVAKLDSTGQKVEKVRTLVFAVAYTRPPLDSRASPTQAEARFTDERKARDFAAAVQGTIRVL